MGFFNSLPVPEPSKVIPAHPWTKIGLALAHQTPVCVEDDKGAEDEGEDHADDVDLRHKIPRQDEGRAREVPGFRVLLVENQ